MSDRKYWPYYDFSHDKTCELYAPLNPVPAAEPQASQTQAKSLWPKWCEEGDHPYFPISNGPTEYKCIICHLTEENDRAEATNAALTRRIAELKDKLQSVLPDYCDYVCGDGPHGWQCEAARAALVGRPEMEKGE